MEICIALFVVGALLLWSRNVNALDEIRDELKQLTCALNQLSHKGDDMKAEIADLVSQVAALSTVQASAVALINGIADRIDAAVANASSLSTEDRAALEQTTSDIKSGRASLAAAVVANTPVASVPTTTTTTAAP